MNHSKQTDPLSRWHKNRMETEASLDNYKRTNDNLFFYSCVSLPSSPKISMICTSLAQCHQSFKTWKRKPNCWLNRLNLRKRRRASRFQAKAKRTMIQRRSDRQGQHDAYFQLCRLDTVRFLPCDTCMPSLHPVLLALKGCYVQIALHSHFRACLRKAKEGVDPEDPQKLVDWDDIDLSLRTSSAQSFALQYGLTVGAVSSTLRQ